MKPTIITEEEARRLKEQLEDNGLEEGIDFYVEKVYEITEYCQARGYCIATEGEYDNKDYFIDFQDMEIDDVMHTEKTTIGYTLTNDKGYIDISGITMMNIGNACCVCGKKLAVRRIAGHRDKRMEADGLKCFDCTGLPAKMPMLKGIIKLPIKEDK